MTLTVDTEARGFAHTPAETSVSAPADAQKFAWWAAWRTCRAALERGDNAAAARAWEAWDAADAALRDALDADAYENFADAHAPAGGRWLP